MWLTASEKFCPPPVIFRLERHNTISRQTKTTLEMRSGSTGFLGIYIEIKADLYKVARCFPPNSDPGQPTSSGRRKHTFPPMTITDLNSHYRTIDSSTLPESFKQIVRLSTVDFVHISVGATLIEIVFGWRRDGIVTAYIKHNVTDHFDEADAYSWKIMIYRMNSRLW